MEKIPTWIPVVALALHDNQGRCLMHLRGEEKHHGGLWEFPGGKVESGEKPANALVREIDEELGITLDAASIMPAHFAEETVEAGKTQIVILLYTFTGWTGQQPVQPSALEGGAVGWFTPAEIELLDKPPLDILLSRQLFGQDRQTDRN
jgi:8-oxo-dGTP diphosphatase